MNIYDIAEKSGVSIATVSRVLNNSSKVSPKTRAKVLSVIEANNYVAATAFSLKKVSILCTSILNNNIAVMCENLMSRFKAQGIEAVLHICGYNLADKKNILDNCVANHTSAIIILGSDFLEYNSESNSYIANAAKNLPVFLAEGFIDAPGIYCTFYDLEKAVHNLVDELSLKGRSHPLFIFSSMSQKCMHMLNGYRSACAHNKLELGPEYSHVCKYGDTKKYIFSLLEQEIPIDAIIASDDKIAIEATSCLISKGFSIPDDVEIIGCGDSTNAATFTPALSSLLCRGDELCDYIYNSLMNFAKSDTSTKTVFGVSLNKRETTR